MATESTDLTGDGAQRRSPHSAPVSEPRPSRQRQLRPHATRDVFSAMTDQRVSQALGWFSVGLGVAELLAPRSVGALTGVGPRTGLLRSFGLREIVAGVGLLNARDPTPWLWSRVVGDAMDLMVLGAAAAKPAAGGRSRPSLSLALVAGVTAADIAASLSHSRQRATGALRPGAIEKYLERSAIIGKSPQECYDYWRNLSNAPNFMRMIESVTDLGDRRSHWIAKIPGGPQLEWDSRISEDLPGQRIAWHSLPESPLLHAGVVSFERAPGNRGTIVRLVLHYRPPSSRARQVLARTFGWAPGFEIREDLRRFKQILETGEIPTTRGQPAGRRSLLMRMARAGRSS